MTSQKIIYIILGIILVSVLAFSGYEFLKPKKQIIEKDFQGRISLVDISANHIRIVDKDTGEEFNAIFSKETKFLGKDGAPIEPSYLRKGFLVGVKGKLFIYPVNKIEKPASLFVPSEITVVEEPNIIVFSPLPNEEIGLPLITRGEARVFESTFNYRLKDEDGSILFENHAMANSPDAGFYGPFETVDSYPSPLGQKGTVEVFDYSAKDGSEIDKVSIPVRFKKVESTTLKAFFGNDRLNPGAADAGKFFPWQGGS